MIVIILGAIAILIGVGALILDGMTVMRPPKKPVEPFVMPKGAELEELLYTPPRMWENTPTTKRKQ